MRITFAVLVLVAALAPVDAATDVGVDTILVPDGNVADFRWAAPSAVCRNYGADTTAFTAWLTIQDSAGPPCCSESLGVECLVPGSETTLAFPNWCVPGHDAPCPVATCSTFATGDGNEANDVGHRRFEIGLPCM